MMMMMDPTFGEENEQISAVQSGGVEDTYRYRLYVFCIGVIILVGIGIGVSVGTGFPNRSETRNNTVITRITPSPTFQPTPSPTTFAPVTTSSPTDDNTTDTANATTTEPTTAMTPVDGPTVAPTPLPTPLSTPLSTPQPTFGSVPPTTNPVTENPTQMLSSSPSLSRTEEILQFLRPIIGSAPLDNRDSNYFLTVQWLSTVDPLSMPVTNPNFLERFILAFWYIEATNRGRLSWRTCNAPETMGSRSDCTFDELVMGGTENTYNQVPSRRWLSGEHQCMWAGVDCFFDQSVDSIHLGAHSIRGTLPSELGLLRNARTLSLIRNQIVGPLPSEIGQFSDLELQFNQFTGTLPPELFQRNYARFNAANNSLTGPLPDPMASPNNDVRGLFLFDNQLTGTIPTSIGLLTRLTFTRLDDNNFVGTIPSEVGFLGRLGELWLHRNLLTGDIPSEIGFMTSLTDLSIFANRLKSTLPDALYRLTALERLLAGRQFLSGTMSTLIGQLTNLTSLDLDNNLLSGTIPSELGTLTSLERLELQWNSFTGVVPNTTCQLPASSFVFVMDCLSNPELTIMPLPTSPPVSPNATTPPPPLGPLPPNSTYNQNGAEVICECCSNCCLQNLSGNFCV